MALPDVLKDICELRASTMKTSEETNMHCNDTLEDATYRKLKQAFLNGFFKPGDPFVIRQVAIQLGVSEMPVREAVKRLVTEKTLIRTATRRFKIPPMTRYKLQEIYDARILIECRLAAQAAIRATPEDIAELKELQAKIVEEGKTDIANKEMGVFTDTSKLMRHTAFHFSVYRSARNETLMPLVESLWLQNAPAMAQAELVWLHQTPLAQLRKNYSRWNRKHMALINAISKREPEQASEILADDLARPESIANALGLPRTAQESPKGLNEFVAAS